MCVCVRVYCMCIACVWVARVLRVCRVFCVCVACCWCCMYGGLCAAWSCVEVLRMCAVVCDTPKEIQFPANQSTPFILSPLVVHLFVPHNIMESPSKRQKRTPSPIPLLATLHLISNNLHSINHSLPLLQQLTGISAVNDTNDTEEEVGMNICNKNKFNYKNKYM